MEEDSSADEAGPRIGDVVVAFDGQPIDDATTLTTSLAQYDPGVEVELTVIRDGDRRTVDAEPGGLPRDGTSASRAVTGSRSEEVLGFRVEELTPALAARLGHEGDRGVVVSSVSCFSNAGNAGIRAGQIILKMNGEPIRTMSDFRSAAESVEPESVVSVRVVDPQLGETIVNYRAR